MPIIIPQNLPAGKILKKENIFVMNDDRALHQDIRPLRIAIVNLMPNKSLTETQLLRILSNFPLQLKIDLVYTETYKSKTTPEEHLETFYKTFSEIKDYKYDGMIITGAPIEKMRFGDVTYWSELKEIMDYSKANVTSTFHICWAAQAALYHHYRVHNYILEEKHFGVFKHRVRNPQCELLRGYDDEFWVPHSCHTEVNREEVEAIDELEILSDSEEAGIYLIGSRDGSQFFSMGHSEYDANTLKDEYVRDLKKGEDIAIPKNYFPDDDVNQAPIVRWKGHGSLLFGNWLNYYVYQITPYDLYA
ncbi:MAG TPA: homoserine O-succinyltransferase [Syntrophomonadaceae bacterium]|nr:homoserine O-succinyltransferase [Syntrophomonadaceae bacterium]